MGPGRKLLYCYTDGSAELGKAKDDLEWVNDTSTPYRPETDGVAERAVRRVNGTGPLGRCGLLQCFLQRE